MPPLSFLSQRAYRAPQGQNLNARKKEWRAGIAERQANRSAAGQSACHFQQRKQGNRFSILGKVKIKGLMLVSPSQHLCPGRAVKEAGVGMTLHQMIPVRSGEWINKFNAETRRTFAVHPTGEIHILRPVQIMAGRKRTVAAISDRRNRHRLSASLTFIERRRKARTAFAFIRQRGGFRDHERDRVPFKVRQQRRVTFPRPPLPARFGAPTIRDTWEEK